MYVRPHELEIERSSNGGGSLAARIERINSAGSVAKVVLSALDGGGDLSVELSPERFGELDLKTGETVYVLPRKVRVFVPDYVI
jgi:sulfate transport system ATP-binding protein